MDQKYQVLALSGGGARGVYTAQVLAELESRFKVPIASCFDMICGTSIGGILALGLAAHIPASAILATFEKHRKNIFPPFPDNHTTERFWRLGLSKKDVGQIRNAQYQAGPLKSALEDIFDERKVKDLASCALIPAINYTVGRMRAFKTPHNSMFYQDGARTLVDVALATSAAPTYFPIHSIEGDRFVDGGLAANNPILMGIVELRRACGAQLEQISGLCIGNMGQGLAVNHEKPLDLGYKGWGFGKDIISLSMSIGEQLHFDMARMLLDSRLEIIDSEATEQQANLLSLDNGSDAAAEILRGHARNRAGQRVNDKEIIELFQHTASVRPITGPHEP
ncbi:CBASS cGAMP-activated phospholipase [Candidatus Litorirhabdus singularis]|nr:CBASS cGAMP-activated phospholipase [Candidatus Litorirhabdus singularis]